jgi:hypothetical protein
MNTAYLVSAFFFIGACLLAVIFEDEARKRGRKPVRGFRALGSVPKFKDLSLRRLWFAANLISMLMLVALFVIVILDFGFGVDDSLEAAAPIVFLTAGVSVAFKAIAWARADIDSFDRVHREFVKDAPSQPVAE